MNRKKLLTYLAQSISNLERQYPIRVAIDGVDAAGKTTLAEELAEEVRKLERSVIRASIDGFHKPRAIRYQRGENSAEGYYLDSFDHQAIIDSLLQPLSPEGNLKYQTTVFDFLKNTKVDSPKQKAPTDSILLMEGVFLHRPELIPFWDLTIFLDVDFEITLKRALNRALENKYLGSKQDIIDKYNQRYIPGQKIYLEAVKPHEKADIIIDNSVFENPVLIK